MSLWISRHEALVAIIANNYKPRGSVGQQFKMYIIATFAGLLIITHTFMYDTCTPVECGNIVSIFVYVRNLITALKPTNAATELQL